MDNQNMPSFTCRNGEKDKKDKRGKRDSNAERKTLKSSGVGPAWLDADFDQLMNCGFEEVEKKKVSFVAEGGSRPTLGRTGSAGVGLAAKKRTSLQKTLGLNESGFRRGAAKHLTAREVYSNAFASTCSDITAPEFEKSGLPTKEDFDNRSQLNDAFEIDSLDLVFVHTQDIESDSVILPNEINNFDEEFCESELIERDSSISDNLRSIMKYERNHEVFLKLTSVINDLNSCLNKSGLENKFKVCEKKEKNEAQGSSLEPDTIFASDLESKQRVQVCCGGCNLF